MAILDFPLNPNNGDIYNANGRSWIYDSTSGSWKSNNVLRTLGIVNGGTGLSSINAGDAFLSSNSSGTALTYRTFIAGTNMSISIGASSVTFNSTGTGGANIGYTVFDGNNFELAYYFQNGTGVTGAQYLHNVGTGLSLLYGTDSSSTSTGALVVRGGVGITGNINIGGNLTISTAIATTYGGTGLTSYNKGDLLAGVASSVLSVHRVGSDGLLLKADSTSSTGITWAENIIGNPSDTTYTDGFFDSWTNNTKVSEAMDDINELLKLIAPGKPSSMDGGTLTATTVPTYYTVRISGGLGTEWYEAGYGTGTQITRYYLTGAHTLSSPSPTTTFQAGTLTTSTYGIINFLTYSNLYPSGFARSNFDITSRYTEINNNGLVRLTALDIYQSIWTKANARINAYTQATSGYEGFKLSHSNNIGLAQTTSIYEVWRDLWSNSNPNPSFATSATAATFSIARKYLSGISYFTTGTGFSVYFSSSVGIYSSAYNTTRIFSVSATGLATSNWSPSSAPNYNDIVDYTSATTSNVGYRVLLDTSSQSSFGQSVRVSLFKAHGTGVTSNAAIDRYINTYTSLSTDTNEQFQDEDKRLLVDQNVAWDSTTGLGSSDLQVRSGTLRYPVAADYQVEYGGSPTFTGVREYQRRFTLESASSGRFTFTGVSGAAVSEHGVGNLNMLIYLEGDQKYFDLGKPAGIGASSGDLRTDAFGGRLAVVGTGVTFTLGSYTTGVAGAGNGGSFRLIVIYRNTDPNTAPQLTRLQLSRNE